MPAFPRVGTYRISAEIGRGGMGVVYLAHDPGLDRTVAIKALPAELAGDESRLARFEREARVLAGLSHPSIATVYGLEREGNERFLVMELVAGETLAQRLERGRLPIEEALSVCAQIAGAVEAAHERGVVHRDLKPGNVMLQPDGTLKVLDFGLAREAVSGSTASRRAAAPTSPAPITVEGVAVGTPGYMSPEQARGREVDRRTDVFALGCLLYESLCGQPAFGGDSAADAVAAALERDPDWSLLPDRTPPRVRELLGNCLAKDVKRRLRDIGDARLELERALERREWTSSGSMRAAPAAQRSWRGAVPWMVAAVALASLGIVVWQRGSPPLSPSGAAVARRPVRFTLSTAETRHRHTFDLASLAISNDGAVVAYTGWRGEAGGLCLRHMNAAVPRVMELAEPWIPHNPAFSPDGRWIAFASGPSLLKIPTEGGQPVPIFQGEGLTKGHCWTERGIVLSPRLSGGLALLDPDGGTPVELTTPDAARSEVSHRWPDALPDGRQVLFTVKKAGMATFDDADIALLDLETGAWKTVIQGGMYARYSPSGHIVYARADALLAVPFDLASGALRGAPIEMVRGVVTEPGSGAAQFALARDAGTLVYVPGVATVPRCELVWIDLDGTITPTSAPQLNYSGAILSPDGKRVALGAFGATDSIFVFDTERETMTRTTFEGNASDPFWSRDNRRIGLVSDRDGAQALYSVVADGSGTMERLSDDMSGTGRSFVELDGEEVVLSERGRELWIQPRGAPARMLSSSPVPMAHVIVSPDQRWFAYDSSESGQLEIYVRPFPDGEGKWQVSIGGGAMPWWLAGSQALAYRGNDGMIRIVRSGPAGFAGARPEVLCAHPAAVAYLDLLPDASRFIALRPVRTPPDSERVEAVLHWSEELKAKVPVNGE